MAVWWERKNPITTIGVYQIIERSPDRFEVYANGAALEPFKITATMAEAREVVCLAQRVRT